MSVKSKLFCLASALVNDAAPIGAELGAQRFQAGSAT